MTLHIDVDEERLARWNPDDEARYGVLPKDVEEWEPRDLLVAEQAGVIELGDDTTTGSVVRL